MVRYLFLKVFVIGLFPQALVRDVFVKLGFEFTQDAPPVAGEHCDWNTVERPSAGDRNSTPLASHMRTVDYCATAKRAQSVYRPLRCFLDESTCPHVDAGWEKCSRRFVPNISCVRFILALHEGKFVAVEDT